MSLAPWPTPRRAQRRILLAVVLLLVGIGLTVFAVLAWMDVKPVPPKVRGYGAVLRSSQRREDAQLARFGVTVRAWGRPRRRADRFRRHALQTRALRRTSLALWKARYA
jgi:hypothetical protein